MNGASSRSAIARQRRSSSFVAVSRSYGAGRGAASVPSPPPRLQANAGSQPAWLAATRGTPVRLYGELVPGRSMNKLNCTTHSCREPRVVQLSLLMPRAVEAIHRNSHWTTRGPVSFGLVGTDGQVWPRTKQRQRRG